MPADSDGPKATTTRGDGQRDRRSDPVVLFDMDGVLVEGDGSNATVHARALTDVLEDPEIDLDHAHLSDLSAENRETLEAYEYTPAFETVCESIEIDPADLYRRREAYSADRIVDRIRAGTRGLYADVDAISEVQNQCVTGVVSSNYDAVVAFVLEHFELDSFAFARGRSPGVDGFYRRKPNPYYLTEALEALDSTEGYYVGDRASDLVAAERVGLEPVLVRRPHNEALEPALETYIEIETLAELSEVV
ncbi:HAD family hydrolase [Natronolimnobius sp. AArcel1]|uniref:HAD family hydrolase n=1 Tax=Natronolimnobius sp. AArcel1 TaxID=1679093 RepID=UPI0013ECDE31|nr:HAD-IA family hydrolase [Natronolimnobius sp. AArcel1]NGM69353.1 HAD family hydrolase [Natronolimnobius sp. AArcel1]